VFNPLPCSPLASCKAGKCARFCHHSRSGSVVPGCPDGKMKQGNFLALAAVIGWSGVWGPKDLDAEGNKRIMGYHPKRSLKGDQTAIEAMEHARSQSPYSFAKMTPERFGRKSVQHVFAPSADKLGDGRRCNGTLRLTSVAPGGTLPLVPVQTILLMGTRL